MKIHLKSTVEGTMQQVFHAFDESLFRYLLPPGAKLIRFDGSASGDIVHLKLPPGVEWISEITESSEKDDHCYFIDRGVRLPWPLTFWKHTHHVFREGEGSRIEDEMEFRTSIRLLDLLIYPVLYLSFLPRVSQYKKYFREKNSNATSTRSHSLS